jgi:crotonobetainyl-CoA:carnitine CoA-transferase CaiB-like acyl-CoA transferase
MPDKINDGKAENKGGLTRRSAVLALGGSTIGAALAGSIKSAAAQNELAPSLPEAGPAPLATVRVIELSQTLAGRLAGQLFADQGAEVYVERTEPSKLLDDTYFDRGKRLLPSGGLDDTSSADVIIVDGDAPVDKLPHQIVMRVVAALPGDEVYGFLPADCSEDLVNALVGFFTDMSITGPMLGRPVIYTPLPLCSVYAGVNGSIAVVAALVDRTRTGLGREVLASRLAGGLSAIGALTITDEGLPPHLRPIQIGGLPPGMSPEQFTEITTKAAVDPAWQLWLEQRFAPLAAPYRTSDGHLVLPLAGANRRLTRRMLEAFDLYNRALDEGMVDVSSFDAANAEYARNNLADSIALRFDLTSKLADWLEPVFANRTAAELEAFLVAFGVPVTRVNSFEEWKRDRQAREARIFADVVGTDALQIGRMAWLASAQPYPPLSIGKSLESLPPRSTPLPRATGVGLSEKPLAGYSMLDLSNVIAGPATARMFAELGVRVVQSVPPEPNHSVTIVVAWAGELGGGKRSIILSTRTEEGMKVMLELAAQSDFVLNNAMDPQMARLRLDPASLHAMNPRAIGVQITALRGERLGPRHNDTGYDPAQQGTTGIMHRFGPPGAPMYHGIASAVDYLCGYLGTWAGVTALYARETRDDGRGDWAETSLAAAATLTQLLLQNGEPPASAVGPYATGMTEGQRVYRLSDGWIFAHGTVDLSAELEGKTQAEALAFMGERNVLAVPVQTCRQVANRHRDNPTITVNFERRESDGWINECFAPTWFTFDGMPFARPAAAPRLGASGPEILAELGYSEPQIAEMIAIGAVGRTEWAKG